MDIETLYHLPKWEGRKANLTRRFGSMWSMPRFDHYYPYSKEKDPYVICKRILEKNINKSFDLAFSYYCKQVPFRYQYIFLQEVERFRYRSWNFEYYYVENGLIIKYKKDWKYWKPVQDYRYWKRFYESKDKRRKERREYKKEQERLLYCPLNRSELERKQNKADDLRKIISHEFDPKTSFRN